MCVASSSQLRLNGESDAFKTGPELLDNWRLHQRLALYLPWRQKTDFYCTVEIKYLLYIFFFTYLKLEQSINYIFKNLYFKIPQSHFFYTVCTFCYTQYKNEILKIVSLSFPIFIHNQNLLIFFW